MRAPGLAPAPGLEIWAGVECTVNRVGDRQHDQLEWNGHARRLDDLDRLAWLGCRAIRYPVLWERTAPHGLASADFSWADARLDRLHALGIRPIVGLVHHGSGPIGTSLLDPAFPERLAEYAGAVARRYPFVADWTPINEIVTTARFSALYGHWYPHARDGRSFVRAVLQQCRATVLAMQAVREVVPGAQLVQTDDLGWTLASPGLESQARHENARRLLAFDLLTGRVDPRHPLWGYLLDQGAGLDELVAFIEQPCPPDIIGLNHYLTSDRWLDQDLAGYPARCHGGNGRVAYADVEAVRAARGRLSGHHRLLAWLWARYRTPLAITEVHLGCSRDEQVRWLAEAYRAAARARVEGVDVRAVTAWAAFGAFHWDRLCTSADGNYEPGLFDVRSEPPRPTLLAHATRSLAHGQPFAHPVLATPGWWRRPGRILFPAPVADAQAAAGPPLIITGAAGGLARALARAAAGRGLPVRLFTRAQLDIGDRDAVARALTQVAPWGVINAAGYTRVDAAEHEPERCHRANVEGPRTLAEACHAHGLGFLTFSSDLVFGGQARQPYRESAATEPLGVYGASKLRGEQVVLNTAPAALVIRSSAFFGSYGGAGGDTSFVARALDNLIAGVPVDAADDLVVSPTYLPELAEAAIDLLLDGEAGVWHLANAGAVTYADLARQLARAHDLDPDLVRGRPSHALAFRAPRPAFSALGSERGQQLGALEPALGSFARAHRSRCEATP